MGVQLGYESTTKSYRTRDGQKATPVEGLVGCFRIPREANVQWYAANGEICRVRETGYAHPLDLVAEWARLKAGTYYDGYGDRVEIRDHTNPRWPFTDGKRYFDENGRFSGDNRKLDLIAEWTDGPVFTVGAKVRRSADGKPWAPIGYETTVSGTPGNLTYRDNDGDEGSLMPECWTLITEGPVRTVTRREVVKGVHSGVLVMGATDTHVAIAIHDPTTPNREYYAHGLTSAELKAAAAVLLELAGAL